MQIDNLIWSHQNCPQQFSSQYHKYHNHHTLQSPPLHVKIAFPNTHKFAIVVVAGTSSAGSSALIVIVMYGLLTAVI